MTFMTPGIARVRIGVESTYAADMTGTIGDLDDIRTMEATPGFGQQMLEDSSVVQRYWQRRLSVLGFDRPTYELASYFVGSGQTLNAAASVTKTVQATVLESILGGYTGGSAGSAVVASPSPTTTSFTVTTGHGSRFTAGTHVWVQVGSNYEFNVVKTVSTDALTFKWAFSSAPATSAVVLNSMIVWPEEPSVAQTSLQVLWEAAVNREHIFLLCGMQATSFGVTMALGEMPQWTASLQGAIDYHDDDIATPQGGSAITAASYDGGEPSAFVKGGMLFGPIASTTRTLIDFTSFTFTPNVTHTPIPSPHGTQGIRQMWRERGDAPQVQFTMPIESTTAKTYRAARDAGTKYQIAVFCGGSAGNFRAIECGTVQIMDVVEADAGGRRGMTITCKVLEDENATSQSTAFRRAPFRIAFS